MTNSKDGPLRTQVETLPSIKVTDTERRSLNAVANAGMPLSPRVAQFLAREMERAQIVGGNADLRGAVRIESQVSYRDEGTSLRLPPSNTA
ncbi:hypothetical protein MTX26_28955 [Bradyrhizobium sp. ISRA443]|uniref:hypothetical protein n=1 Tax=unclassified Bradyrhizobium TaxID=2631580 RepID=UPI002478FB50|nr:MULTISPECIES: hypothetical protein [unclassified Bradyrhizobium]WGR93673.1 hypothetical protein MTX20_03845 [Bradyrhizobium sp. ISRA435]WGR98247.1 hypothetical protein MTX23_28945 [Bradyrhizobium sp. ISRA436]WGS05136.1 hypothetical protein MTX18_28960 [Bradyrhizobium sp. ISRA437]WGS12021.1 hypothetical protein MTX26_28955 [Bradyrhizobium sp. ISRA443]